MIFFVIQLVVTALSEASCCACKSEVVAILRCLVLPQTDELIMHTEKCTLTSFLALSLWTSQEEQQRSNILARKQEKEAGLMDKAANIQRVRAFAAAQADLRRMRGKESASASEVKVCFGLTEYHASIRMIAYIFQCVTRS